MKWKAAALTGLILVVMLLLGMLAMGIFAGVGLVACYLLGKPLTLDWAMAADLVVVVPLAFLSWLVGGAIRRLYGFAQILLPDRSSSG
ncbi:hypothetical protein HHS34_005650 [Acidithiobacillus montserratensis]|uniref:Uncharacterized protein n=1 Tax=Acidithiobacillus montserratensis TaxID=2729135 RepID=A0ACD5HL72_9PROT|nr:hypothetical protein [Acidithiobacillus montserratensis]MBU2747838.1 hypothetical protein [Acidithiobacillus montserratensis]